MLDPKLNFGKAHFCRAKFTRPISKRVKINGPKHIFVQLKILKPKLMQLRDEDSFGDKVKLQLDKRGQQQVF